MQFNVKVNVREQIINIHWQTSDAVQRVLCQKRRIGSDIFPLFFYLYVLSILFSFPPGNCGMVDVPYSGPGAIEIGVTLAMVCVKSLMTK